MTLLHGLGVPELFSPELTAEWEFKLAQMEHGKLTRAAFMREIVAMTQHIVGQAKGYESDTIPGDFGTLSARCPKCGGEVHENYKKFQCQSCDFGFWKIMGGRQLEIAEAEALLRDRAGRPARGLPQPAGPAVLGGDQAERRARGHVRFRRRRRRRRPRRRISPGRSRSGACPKCGARVFEMPQAYVCEKAVGPEKTCDFRSGRVILQRPVERAQMQKLLATGKTDLLQFVSARTKRGFSAFLVRQPDGKIGFEFEAKDATKGGARRARGGAAALRVLGPHPEDEKPVELHAGRYGPYVKHGDVNATLPDRDKVDTLTLDEALALLEAKAAKQGGGGVDRRREGAQAAGEDRRQTAGRSPPRRQGPRAARRQTRGTTHAAALRRGEREAQAQGAIPPHVGEVVEATQPSGSVVRPLASRARRCLVRLLGPRER